MGAALPNICGGFARLCRPQRQLSRVFSCKRHSYVTPPPAGRKPPGRLDSGPEKTAFLHDKERLRIGLPSPARIDRSRGRNAAQRSPCKRPPRSLPHDSGSTVSQAQKAVAVAAARTARRRRDHFYHHSWQTARTSSPYSTAGAPPSRNTSSTPGSGATDLLKTSTRCRPCMTPPVR